MPEPVSSLKEDLKTFAALYEVPDFIRTDPVQFPHRYTSKEDIEMVGFITAWLSFGSRQVFIPLLDRLFEGMGESPALFIRSGKYKELKKGKNTLYRFCKWYDLYEVSAQLEDIYRDYASMEEWLLDQEDIPLHTLQKRFGHVTQIPGYGGSSACKKLHMFLRWMIRDNSPVDPGIWSSFSKKELSVPVDVHVLKQAQRWGITTRKQADVRTVEEVTSFARTVFPDDPARIDFALYGYSVNNPLLETGK